MDYYYLYINNTQQGPYTLAQVQSMWKAGSITSETLYWQEGFDEWIPLSSIIEWLEAPSTKLIPPLKLKSESSEFVQSSPKLPDTLGIILVLLPIAASIFMWFWISQMNILQNPSMILEGISIGTVLLTSMIMAIEASQLGMGNKTNTIKSTGPVGWFFGGVLLWILCYPSYLYSRSRFGASNYILGGIVSAVTFIGVVYYMNVTILNQKGMLQQKIERSEMAKSAPTPVSDSPSVHEFLREARRMVSAISTGVTYNDFKTRLPELVASTEEAISSSNNKVLNSKMALFTQSLIDVDSIWKFKNISAENRIELKPANDRFLANCVDLQRLRHNQDNRLTNCLSERWLQKIPELSRLYGFEEGEDSEKAFFPGMLIIDNAIQKIFIFSARTFREIEALSAS